MRQIRRNVFETNSSSTHSMAIPINCDKNYPSYFHFYIGEYGWEMDEVDPANYFYTGIACISKNKDEFLTYMNKLIEILDKNNIRYDFEEPDFKEEDGFFYLNYGYIDHHDELIEFIDYLFDNEDKLLNFISYGRVFTGNDNDDESHLYVSRNDKDLAENYEWHFKGN